MFHEKVKETRMRRNMTQKQLADAAQIAVGSVSAYENGQKVPPVDAAGRIAAALGVSLDWLLSDFSAAEAVKPSAGSMGDVARAFLVMVDAGLLYQSQYEYISWRKSMLEFEDADRAFYETVERTGENPNPILRLSADFSSDQFTTFLEGVYKLNELVRRGTIDHDIYSTWLAKLLEQMDKIPLPKAELCNL